MKNCKYCGAQLADDDDYCYFCGRPFEEEKIDERIENVGFVNNDDNNSMGYLEDNNSIAKAGFIFSFFIPIVGFVLSVIGLSKANRLNGKNKGYAVAGILISVASWIISFALYFIFYANEFENGGF